MIQSILHTMNSFLAVKISVQERWDNILEAWTLYKQHPEKPDALVNVLIKLDSFVTYVQQHNLDDVSLRSAHVLQLIEKFTTNGNPNLEQADSAFDTISTMVHLTNAQHFRPLKKSDVENNKPHITLYWPNSEEAGEIMSQLEHYGYDSEIMTSPAKAVRTALEKRSSAVVLDISREAPASMELYVSEVNKADIPWIGVSDKGTFEERLAMVRMNIFSFLVKPITASALVDTIDKGNRYNIEEPYKVLVVDDSPVTGHWVKTTLQPIGIDVHVLPDVSRILQTMHDINPDLVLLDIRMPFCTGLEVAQIIRQHESFVSTPLVYLSSETNRQIQYQAIKMGGDEFLVKPVHEDELIAVVSSKIERARSLRRFMVQDSLTGLLNHTRIKQHLAQSIMLAKRDNTPVSFAMLDIDHFKKVNDQYGHPVGDRVIKSWAKMLRQRVRKSDVVGRYGGEEFAVVLHGAGLDDAYRIMNRIREDFSQVYHTYEDGIFASTFSCGIAGFPGLEDPNVVAAKADLALYESKRGGRNKVSLFGKKPPQDI